MNKPGEYADLAFAGQPEPAGTNTDQRIDHSHQSKNQEH